MVDSVSASSPGIDFAVAGHLAFSHDGAPDDDNGPSMDPLPQDDVVDTLVDLFKISLCLIGIEII